MTRFEIFAPERGTPGNQVRVGVVEARKDLTDAQAREWAKQIARIFGELYHDAWIDCNVEAGNMAQPMVGRLCREQARRMLA